MSRTLVAGHVPYMCCLALSYLCVSLLLGMFPICVALPCLAFVCPYCWGCSLYVLPCLVLPLCVLIVESRRSRTVDSEMKALHVPCLCSWLVSHTVPLSDLSVTCVICLPSPHTRLNRMGIGTFNSAITMYLHASIGGRCKITTYLESQIPSFLLTIQFLSDYDDDFKGH